MSNYISKIEFERHKKENEQEFSKIWEDIEKIKELINKILNMIKQKVSLSDLEDLKIILLGKLDEFAIACKKNLKTKWNN